MQSYSQYTLWLYPLIMVSALAMVMYLRLGLSWGWAGFVQSAITLALALVGMFFGPDWLFALLGWSFLLLRGLMPNILLRRLAANLTLYKADAAERDAQVLSYFQWGKPGRFWRDVAHALSLYLNDQSEKAEQLLQSWQKETLPRQFDDTLQTTLLMGRVVHHDWDAIINQFNELRASSKRISYGLTTYASRAFAEKGLISQSLTCLEASNVPATRVLNETRVQLFVPFFALAGGMSELVGLLDQVKSLPRYAKLAWTARCNAARGDIETAKQQLEESLDLIADTNTLWKRRITEQLRKLETDPPTAQDWSAEIARATRLMERATIVGEIVSPKQRCLAVSTIVVLLIVAFIASHAFEYVVTPLTAKMGMYAFNWGALDVRFLHGQWWRGLTYLFLHAHISHLLMNLIGLWWFGRIAENIFGTRAFVCVYIASGIASAFAQVLIAPSMPAVGASGSVMGLFGSVIAGFFRLKHIVPDSIRKSELSWLIGFALAQIALDQIVPKVAAFAHLGGLITGLLIGFVIPLRGVVRLARQTKEELARA
jgi:membrane associated rhomboid family serine protease